MALKKKKNPFALLRAEVKRRKAEQEKKRNKPKPQGNRSIARPATTTGAVPKTSLKQRALNVKGKAKSVVRKAKGKAQAAVAKVDTKAERSAIAKGVGKRVSTAAKNAKTKAKDIYRKADTPVERRALAKKAKELAVKKAKAAKAAVSSKAKSVGKNLKAQANFRLNKLTGTGTKSRAKFKKDFKFAAKALPGKLRVTRSNTAAKLRGVGVKAQLKGLKVKGNIMKGLREAGIGAGRGKLRSKNKMTPATTRFGKGARATGKAIRSAKRNVRAAGSAAMDKGKALSSAARNWSEKKKAAMQKLWNRNKK